MKATQSTSFDEAGFWDKLATYARIAGYELVQKCLWLYYAAQSPTAPAWAKSVIYGALAYFVLPIDAIPDMIPITGFTDDLGALSAAVLAVAMFIDDDVRERADERLRVWFGDAEDRSGAAA